MEVLKLRRVRQDWVQKFTAEFRSSLTFQSHWGWNLAWLLAAHLPVWPLPQQGTQM